MLAADGVDLPLPLGVGWSSASVGGHFHQVALHFLAALHLESAGALIDSRDHRPADGDLQGVHVPRRVTHRFQPGGRQVCHAAADGGLVVKCARCRLEPRSIQRPFKLPGGGVSRGRRDVGHSAVGLLRASSQQVPQSD